MEKREPSDVTDKQRLEQFDADMEKCLGALGRFDNVDAVVGVPFHTIDRRLSTAIQMARIGLKRMGLSRRSIVVCVGPRKGNRALAKVVKRSEPHHGVAAYGLLLRDGLGEYGWCIRALFEVSAAAGAPLLVVPPELVPLARDVQPQRGGEATTVRRRSRWRPWLASLLTPVRDHDQDLAFARFTRHPLSHSVESHLVYPIVTGVFGFRLRQPVPGVFALSPQMTRSCLTDDGPWWGGLGFYGLGPWLTSHGLSGDFSICEVPLDVAPLQTDLGKLDLVFRQTAHALFWEVDRRDQRWLERPDPIMSPSTAGPFPEPFGARPCRVEFEELHRRFTLGFYQYDDSLYRHILSDELRDKLRRLAESGPAGEALTAEEWILALREFMLVYGFDREFVHDDIVDGLFPCFLARLIGFARTFEDDKRKILGSAGVDEGFGERLLMYETERALEKQADVFVSRRREFRRSWRDRETAVSSYLPRLGAWEFVPHVGVILPQEIKTGDGGSVWASAIYQELIDRYRTEFIRFLSNHLGIDHVEDSSVILRRVYDFMHELDAAIDSDIVPPDLSTQSGAREVATWVCHAFGPATTFQMTPEAARLILERTPPANLIMQLGCRSVGGLLESLDACDALALASWTDHQNYVLKVLDVIDKDGRPDWFHEAPITPIVANQYSVSNDTELRGAAAPARLVGRVIVATLERGWGGEFPKTWFFLRLIKSIVAVELFSHVWRGLSGERGEFGRRIVETIRGHWGRSVLSAHNAFENRQQRIAIERLGQVIDQLRKRRPDKSEALDLLQAATEVYHLAITLPDATFVPLSAWTWASHSYDGGSGAPPPLSSVVERDWATKDFLTRYLEQAGLGNERTIDDKVVALIRQGRESDNLRNHLLGITADPDQLRVTQTATVAAPPTGRLTRPFEEPILEPTENRWESRYVLNAAAVRLDGTIYILYRAYGEDSISRIGLAWTKDGLNIEGRLAEPIFESSHPSEDAGCEDPRVTVIDERLYMLYTAWDHETPQIAMASIPVEAFLDHRFDRWERHGLGFPGLANKDAVLYPEKFNGGYVIYHRIEPSIWISYLDSLRCPWPRTGQKIVVGPRSGMMWDGVKIGAGAQPIKTTHGWLNIYHGVDYERWYRLGVLFMALDDPSKVVYQSPNPVLEPETEFEIGTTGGRDYWVPHVVFTCGAVPARDTDVVGLDDEILVYYGAADTALCVASGKLRDLVPVLDGTHRAVPS